MREPMDDFRYQVPNSKLQIAERRLRVSNPESRLGDRRPAPAGRGRTLKRCLAAAMLAAACLVLSTPIYGGEEPNRPASLQVPAGLAGGPEQWASPEGLSSALQVMLLLTVLSLAPAILLMTTCFVRVVVVLSLLRQAIGTQTLPPNQVITSLALFITLLIMAPVWKQVYQNAIVPYTQKQMDLQHAWAKGAEPVRRFMSMQIERTGNAKDVWLFLRYAGGPPPSTYDEVPLTALLPAFVLSELKTAFLIGFQVYLPFLILDMVIASVMVSMGMLMLPPVLISLPFKILLFVLVDGWNLVINSLVTSFH